jgi:hypothetical protein
MKALVFDVFAREVSLFFFSDLKILSIDFEICAESIAYILEIFLDGRGSILMSLY